MFYRGMSKYEVDGGADGRYRSYSRRSAGQVVTQTLNFFSNATLAPALGPVSTLFCVLSTRTHVYTVAIFVNTMIFILE